jgi:hypothetical protein
MGWWSGAGRRRSVDSGSRFVGFTIRSSGGASVKPVVTDFVALRTVILLRHFHVCYVTTLVRKRHLLPKGHEKYLANVVHKLATLADDEVGRLGCFFFVAAVAVV